METNLSSSDHDTHPPLTLPYRPQFRRPPPSLPRCWRWCWYATGAGVGASGAACAATRRSPGSHQPQGLKVRSRLPSVSSHTLTAYFSRPPPCLLRLLTFVCPHSIPLSCSPFRRTKSPAVRPPMPFSRPRTISLLYLVRDTERLRQRVGVLRRNRTIGPPTERPRGDHTTQVLGDTGHPRFPHLPPAA